MTRYWPELALMAAGAALGVAAVVIGVGPARAAEREDRYPPTHQLLVCEPGKDCERRGRPMGATACNLDLASERMTAGLPSGTWLACVRVGERRPVTR